MHYKNIKKGLDYLFLVIISPILIILIVFFSILIKIFNPKENIFSFKIGLDIMVRFLKL